MIAPRPALFTACWLILSSVALFAELTASSVAAERDVAPNILLIVADDLGYSDLGCFGGEIETRHLDRLAAGGVRLTQLYNTGRCCPSRASILTGQYAHRVGLGHMTQDLHLPGYRGRISDDAITIADVLQANHFRTFLSGKWHLGTSDPTAHGFEEFYGTLVSAKTFWDPDHFLRLPPGRPVPKYDEGTFYGTDALTDQAIAFLNSARPSSERPWFLYLAYNAPHFPLHAPPEDIAKYADRYHVGWDEIRERRLLRMRQLGLVSSDLQLSPRSEYWDWGESESRRNPAWQRLPADRRGDLARRMAIYAAMVDRMDRNIGRLVDDLRRNNELATTLILFVSDNGACAEWDPHGFDIRSSRNNILHWDDQLDHMGGPGTFHSVGSGWANASNTPWRLYKHFAHEGGIASPTIVHWPERLSPQQGQMIHTPAHIIDLIPTLLDACGIDYPNQWQGQPTHALPGISLLPMLTGAPAVERALFFEHEGHRAIRRGQWKLCAVRGQPWQLFDMLRDRIETQDLAQQQPQLVAELAQRWQDWALTNHVLPLPVDYQVGYLAP